MLDTTNGRYLLSDVSPLLSALAAAGDWTTHFELLAKCALPIDPKKRQRIPVIVDVGGER
jgi:hypothetical protein